MSKQTFVTGQVLTAAQMTALQANDYNQTVSAKSANYVLVAADAGTRITMSNAGATTITVNTSLFTAGDTLFITNIGAGACTITAGTATVSTASSLVLAQYDSGRLYFTSTGVAIWEKYAGATTAGFNTGYAYTSGAEGTTGTSYAGLTTATAVTVTTGTKALVTVTVYFYNNSNSATCHGYAGYAISGATTVAAGDQYASQCWINTSAASSTNGFSFSSTFLHTGLTAGSNVFTMQYRVNSSESGGFYRRSISVVDLGS